MENSMEAPQKKKINKASRGLPLWFSDKDSTSSAESEGLIPSQGTKISRATCSQKSKK